MAQIRKYTGGGGIIIDGKLYDYSTISDFWNSDKSSQISPEERAALAPMISEIRGGKQIEFDPLSNSWAGEDAIRGAAAYLGSESKALKNYNQSARQRNRHARKNSPEHLFNSASGKMSKGLLSFTQDREKLAQEEKDKNKPRLYKISDPDGFYTTDSEGNTVYLDGPDNVTSESRIAAIFDALNSGDLTGYNLVDWKDDATLGGLTDWWAVHGTSFDRNAFKERLRGNKLTELDWELVSKMGYDRDLDTDDTDDASEEGTGAELTIHKDWKGNQDALRRRGLGVTKEGNNFIFTGNTEFIDENWYGGGLDFLEGTEFEGGGIYGGTPITRQQILSNDPALQGAYAAFMAARHAEGYRPWYDAANTSNIRFTGDRRSLGTLDSETPHYGAFDTQFDPNLHYNDLWSPFFKRLNKGDTVFNVADMSNAFSNLNGRNVLAYIDPDNAYDDLGIRRVKYVVRNTDGSYKIYNSEASLAQAGLQRIQDNYRYAPQKFQRDEWTHYKDKKLRVDRVLNTQGDQQNIIVADTKGSLYLAKKDQNTGEISKLDEITNYALLDRILEDPTSFRNSDLDKLTSVWHKSPGKGSPRQKTKTTQPSTAPASTPSKTKNEFWIKKDYKRPADIILRKKSGGTIPIMQTSKFQYGGAVGKTSTVAEDRNIGNYRTDISADHNVIGGEDDGGLTTAEKWQIAGAVGDLAGVGLSLAPGVGNVAGVATGVASTLTRFHGDRTKDGFQWRDLSRLGSGLVLDLATLAPVLGTGAKFAKTIQSIRNASEPIMKLFTLYGVTSGISAMSRVIKNEKVSSRDVQDILQGIGSTGILAKQTARSIGDAKLAKHAAKTTSELSENSVIGTTLKKTKKEVFDLIKGAKTKENAVKEVQKLLKDAKLTDTAEAAEKVLKDWGTAISSSRWKGKEGWNKINPFVEGKEYVDFKLLKDTKVKSTAAYLLPWNRTKQLGYQGIFFKREGNLGNLTAKEIRAANKAVREGDANLLQKALSRSTMTRNEVFGGPTKLQSKVKSVPVSDKYEWLDNKSYYRDPKQVQIRKKVSAKVEDTKGLPSKKVSAKVEDTKGVSTEEGARQWFARRKQAEKVKPGKTSIFNMKTGKREFRGAGKKLPFFNVDTRKIDYTDANLLGKLQRQAYRAKARAQGGVPSLNSDWLPENIKFRFKRGGKIVKALKGLGLPNYNQKWNEELEALKSGIPSISTPQSYGLNNDFSKVIKPVGRDTFQKTVSLTGDSTYEYDGRIYQTNDPLDRGVPTKLSFESKLPAFSLVESKPESKPETPLFRSTGDLSGVAAHGTPVGKLLGGLGSATWGYFRTKQNTKRQLENAKGMKGPKVHDINMLSYRPQTYGLDYAYDKARQSLRLANLGFKTTDSGINLAHNLVVAGQNAQSYLDQGLQFAESAHNDYQNWLNLKYANQVQNAENANARSKIAASLHNAYLTADSQAAAQDNDNEFRALHDVKGMFDAHYQKKKALKMYDWSDRASTWRAKAYPAYEEAIRTGLIPYTTTFDAWAKDHSDYRDMYKSLKNERNYIQFSKKGSRLRPAHEQVRIDSHKIAAKAIAQLSKQAFEFLKMALK